MREIVTFFFLCTTQLVLGQNPPIALDWSAFLPVGNEIGARNRICHDGDVTAWMIWDDYGMTTSDGIVRRYDGTGIPLDGYSPFTYFGCGSLDAPVDFHFRNDSVWGLMYWQYVGGDQPILYCLTTPGGVYSPAPLFPAYLHQWSTDLLVQGTESTITASYDSTLTIAHQRLTRVDVAGAVIWDHIFPTSQFHGFAALDGMANGDLVVADFPNVQLFSAVSGNLIDTYPAYSGPATLRGDIKIWNGEIYWAATEGGTVHYGRMDPSGAPIWSDDIPGSDVTKITVDDQGHMWLVGTFAGQGVISVIDPNGSVVGSWNYGATLTDVVFDSPRISITGAMNASPAPATFIITGTPDL